MRVTIGKLLYMLRSEDGTAMTEFVITLPIFIFIFAFVWALYHKSHELNRIRYRAATQMWENAMQVQKDGTSFNLSHGQPAVAALDAYNIVSGSPSFSGDWNQNILIGALLTMSSGREMIAGAAQVGVFKSDPNNATSKKFADTMSEDGLTPPPPPNNTPVYVFFPAAIRSIGMTRHAGIIGTRYGAVEGKSTGTASAGPVWGSITFNAQYDTLVSPISYPGGDEYFVVGTSRLLADQDPCLETVLELSTSMSDC